MERAPWVRFPARLLAGGLAVAWLALAAVATSACASQAPILQPDRIPAGHGAVVGRVQVLEDGDDVTGNCSAQFTDAKEDVKAAVSLDDSGWVFTSLPIGTTYLASVSCAVWGGLWYHTRELDFEVVGRGQTTYFGHVRFDLPSNDTDILAQAIAGGAGALPVSVAGAIASNALTAAAIAVRESDEQVDPYVRVSDASSEALREYHARYRAGSGFELFPSLAGRPSRPQAPAPKVVRRGNLIAAEVRLNNLTLVWLGLVRHDKQRIGFRVKRYVRKPELQDCKSFDLLVGDRALSLPVAYKVARASMAFEETIQVETDAALIKSLASAKAASFKACGLSGVLSRTAIEAATRFLATYESMIAELPAVPQQVPTTSTDTTMAEPTSAQAAEGPAGDAQTTGAQSVETDVAGSQLPDSKSADSQAPAAQGADSALPSVELPRTSTGTRDAPE